MDGWVRFVDLGNRAASTDCFTEEEITRVLLMGNIQAYEDFYRRASEERADLMAAGICGESLCSSEKRIMRLMDALAEKERALAAC